MRDSKRQQHAARDNGFVISGLAGCRYLFVVASLVLLAACSPPEPVDGKDNAADSSGRSGDEIYAVHCGMCHDGGVDRAPQTDMIRMMTPEAVLHALTEGVMQPQASMLTDQERVTVAEHVAGAKLGDVQEFPIAHCAQEESQVSFDDAPMTHWGVDGTNQRRFTADRAGMDKNNVDSLELAWVFAFPGANRARSEPFLTNDSIIVGSHSGMVYALNRESGCVRWQYQASSEVRTGFSYGDGALYFGDILGNVYAIEGATGAARWEVRPDDHHSMTITGTPAFNDGSVYVPLSALEVSLSVDPTYECCTFRGSVVSLNAQDGAQNWKTYTIFEEPTVQSQNRVGTDMYGPSGATVWNTPTLDLKRNQLYIGTGENMSSPATGTSDAIIAMDLDSGDVQWVYQATPGDAWNVSCDTPEDASCPEEDGPDYDFGAGTLLATTQSGQDLVLAGQKSGVVHALDPDTGEVVWLERAGRGGIQGGVHFGMAADGEHVYVPISDMEDGRVYPHPSRPGVHALSLTDGRSQWYEPSPVSVCKDREHCHPGNSQAITVAGDLILAGAMDGVLRIHDKDSGELLWSFDTAQTFQSISGATGQGGSLGGAAAPVVDRGMMVVSSGYGIYLHMPGNLMMVFKTNDSGKLEEAP